MNSRIKSVSTRSRGRPRKFVGPSRSVTLTLPQHALDRLALLDSDRARAIVQAVEIAAPSPERDHSEVEVMRVGPGVGLLTVPDCASLRDTPNVSLVEIAPNRNLIVLAPGASLSDLEIAVSDRLEATAPSDADRSILDALLERLRTLRRTQAADTGDVILVRMS